MFSLHGNFEGVTACFESCAIVIIAAATDCGVPEVLQLLEVDGERVVASLSGNVLRVC